MADTVAPGTVLLDGATGTQLRASGARVPSHKTSIWSAAALLEAPRAVVDVHAAYLRAGSDVITTNSYAVTPPLLAREGLESRLEELVGTSVELARAAVEAAGRPARVAGSVPPLETSYRADRVPADAVLRETYGRIVGALAGGVDLLLVETMSCAREARIAAECALESGREVWLSLTLQGNRPRTLPGGEPLEEVLEDVAELPVAALLVNCCGVNLAADALGPLAAAAGGRPFGTYANADEVLPGAFDPLDPEEVPRRSLGPDAWASAAAEWITAGATVVGGCCDTTPEHIAALAAVSRPP